MHSNSPKRNHLLSLQRTIYKQMRKHFCLCGVCVHTLQEAKYRQGRSPQLQKWKLATGLPQALRGTRWALSARQVQCAMASLLPQVLFSLAFSWLPIWHSGFDKWKIQQKLFKPFHSRKFYCSVCLSVCVFVFSPFGDCVTSGIILHLHLQDS